MGVVSVTNITDGTTADGADVNSQVNTILNEFNGNIDNANIKAGAAIATSKLADDTGITAAKIADEAVTSRKLAPTVILESATGDVTLNSTSYADITGCTTTFTPDIACYAKVTAYVDFRTAGAANDVFQVDLDVDGSNQTPAVFFGVPTSGGRFVLSQFWLVSLSAASHTLKLEGKRLSGSNSVVVEADNTRLVVELIGDANVTNS